MLRSSLAIILALSINVSVCEAAAVTTAFFQDTKSTVVANSMSPMPQDTSLCVTLSPATDSQEVTSDQQTGCDDSTACVQSTSTASFEKVLAANTSIDAQDVSLASLSEPLHSPQHPPSYAARDGPLYESAVAHVRCVAQRE